MYFFGPNLNDKAMDDMARLVRGPMGWTESTTLGNGPLGSKRTGGLAHTRRNQTMGVILYLKKENKWVLSDPLFTATLSSRVLSGGIFNKRMFYSLKAHRPTVAFCL